MTDDERMYIEKKMTWIYVAVLWLKVKPLNRFNNQPCINTGKQTFRGSSFEKIYISAQVALSLIFVLEVETRQ